MPILYMHKYTQFMLKSHSNDDAVYPTIEKLLPTPLPEQAYYTYPITLHPCNK